MPEGRLHMTARRKVIIDTDPGVDDVLALLLALASPEIEVLAITTVHGNIDLFNTTRNVIALFNVLHEASNSDPAAIWAQKLFSDRPIVLAAGAKTPIRPETQLDAAYFHGRDGLGGVSSVYPEYCPRIGWEDAFPTLRRSSTASTASQFHGLRASPLPAHEEILSILSREEEDTVSIVAVGPLTNLSLACSKDYPVFSKAKQVIIMGGALTVPGNVTPKAEFNILADPEAAEHVFSFTSPMPASTCRQSPRKVNKQLSITLLPLDTTTTICLSHETWTRGDAKQGEDTLCLKQWCDVFVGRTFETAKSLYQDSSIERLNLSMHDPACVWYLLNCSSTGPTTSWSIAQDVDIRIECTGTWTRGSCVIDQRGRQRIAETEEEDLVDESDAGSWLSPRKGNRIAWVTATPGSEAFSSLLMQRVFGQK